MTRPLFTFKVGQYVDIVNVPHYNNIRIDAITDSGVHIHSNSFGYTVLSGNSPAILHEQTQNANEFEPNKQTEIANENMQNNRAKRGSLKEKMDNLQMPDGEFTIKQFAELNEIPTPYASKWVKNNCAEIGEAVKVDGQRGRASKIYKLLG